MVGNDNTQVFVAIATEVCGKRRMDFRLKKDDWGRKQSFHSEDRGGEAAKQEQGVILTQ